MSHQSTMDIRTGSARPRQLGPGAGRAGDRFRPTPAASSPAAPASLATPASLAAPASVAAREEVLRCRRLSHRTLVEDVSFSVHAGQAYGLFGPDAEARSAVIGMVCGLLDAGRGAVHLHGLPVRDLDPASLHAGVGYVARNAVVLPAGTIGDNLLIWARLGGVPEAELQIRAAEALEQVGLATRRGDPVAGCSGGTVREMGLAVALLHRPRLLVLDDPARGLTPRRRARLVATLSGLRATGTALLVSGRSAADVPDLCDVAGHLIDGRLTAGPADSLPGKLAS